MSKIDQSPQYAALPGGGIQYYDAGNGPCVMLIHGSGPGVNAWANYRDNLPVFAAHFRCIMPDLPGYGGSDARDGDPVQSCVAACVELLDALNISRVHIIGNSLGGIVGSHIAAQYSERVVSFTTIGGIGLNLFSAFPGEGLNLLTAFTEQPSRENLRRWLASMVYDQSIITDELLEARYTAATEPVTLATTRALYSRSAIAAIADYRRGENAAQVVAHLPRIQAPTLITWGRDDRVSPLDISLLPMRMIPNAELHVFPNCGHWAMIECKVRFESLAIDFINDAEHRCAQVQP
ncbi:alpha/beta fold hydrolase [Spongiibacter marinus]|uniref:alpha/beta fold hydrolase n=1 Tax=Spongiibacter marinus TaxID=354246 RepID=UPI00040FD1C2|nr:alpha/beta fold hydrolase [Spongiibacter marinus]